MLMRLWKNIMVLLLMVLEVLWIRLFIRVKSSVERVSMVVFWVGLLCCCGWFLVMVMVSCVVGDRVC